ncbi:MAG TPA: hypothetical protein VLW84_04825 [Terriglobales bacterium]|nr:hypothetical protein [Terriglobales bacterium]
MNLIVAFKAIIVAIACFAAASVRADDSCIAAYGAPAVGQFLRDLQKAVAADDRKQVVQMVEYPITIKVGNKPVRLRKRSELLKLYDVAFDEKVKGFLAKQKFSGLFCNWRGIMVGRGEIWINTAENSHALKIIAINNNPPWSP